MIVCCMVGEARGDGREQEINSLSAHVLKSRRSSGSGRNMA